jgi:hypothetical protein
MVRARINYWVDVVALVSAFLVFPTGLILLARFHIGPDGAQRLSRLGLSRAAWVCLHRSAAIAMTAAVTVHAQLHWRVIVARVQRAYRRLPGKATYSDLALYFGFAAVTPAAFAAWLVLPGLLHHPAIDLHNISALILLPAVVTHVRRHLRWLLR